MRTKDGISHRIAEFERGTALDLEGSFSLGELIYGLRQDINLSRAKLAAAAGISEETVLRIESVSDYDPGFSKVVAIFGVFGLSVGLTQGVSLRCEGGRFKYSRI